MSVLQVNPSQEHAGCFVSIIRSRFCFSVTRGCHLIGLAAGATSLVAGYYFASIDQNSYGVVSYGLGVSGIMMLGYNITGLSYLSDYRKLLYEVSKVSELQEVRVSLEKEIEHMKKVEAELEEEEGELENDVKIFQGHVKNFSDHVKELELELEDSKKLEKGFKEISKQMHEERKELAKEVKSLNQTALEVKQVYEKTQEEQKRMWSALAVMEQKVDAKEESMLKNLEMKEKELKLDSMKSSLRSFQAENSQGYEELVQKYQDLRV